MNREQFLGELCKIISVFGNKETSQGAACFCGENEIANLEAKHGTWRCDSELLQKIADKLGVEWKQEA